MSGRRIDISPRRGRPPDPDEGARGAAGAAAPFVFLGGTLAAYVTLNRRSELTAMRAAGVSAWRFIFPAAATAFLCGVLTTTLVNPAASQLNARYEHERDDLMKGLPARRRPQGGVAARGPGPQPGGDPRQVGRRHRRAEGPCRPSSTVVDGQGVPQFERRVESQRGSCRPWRPGAHRRQERPAGGFEERSGSLTVPIQIRDPRPCCGPAAPTKSRSGTCPAPSGGRRTPA